MRLFFLFVLLLSGAPPFSSGQDLLPDPVLQYRKADALYNKAIALASDENYTEAEEERWNQQALQEYRKLAAMLSGSDASLDSLKFFSYFRIGELEHFFENSDTALLYYQRAIRYQGKLPLQDSFFFKPLLYAGLILNGKNHFDSSLRYLKLADAIQQRYPQKLEEAERLYNNLGSLLYETGNFVQALNYFEKAASVLPLSHPYYRELLVNYRINIAAIHIKLQDFDAARKIYQQLLPSGMHTQEILHNTGLSFLQSGDAKKALQYLRQVSYNNRLEAGLYNDMSRAFLQLEQLDSAQWYLQRAFDAHRKFKGSLTSTDHGLSYKYMADLLVKQGAYESALQNYQWAMHQFYPSYRDEKITANPANYSGLLSYLHLFQTLTAKADTWELFYEKTGNNTALQEALETYTAAFDLADHVASFYDNDEARLFLSQVRYAIHSKPVAASLRMFARTGERSHAYQAYIFDQRSKAAALAYRQQELQLQSKDAEQNEEQQLKGQIARLSIRASRASDSLQLLSFQNDIREAEIRLGRIQENKGSASAMRLQKIPGVQWLQRQLLDRNTAILSYSITPAVLTCFTITSDHFNARQLRISESITTRLAEVNRSLQEFAPVDHSILKDLYRLLIPDSLQEIRRWIVIPDGQLHYLPFEALMDGDNRYLVDRQSVQYQYSTTLLQEEDFSFSRASTLGLAPFVQNRYAQKQLMLPHSLQELKWVKGKTLAGFQATKQEFLQSFRDYNILHLATHASINEKQPQLSHIAFSPLPDTEEQSSLLYLNEISNLPLHQTKLVVLSACATASGRLLQGEGVMSISRAFSYAGCPNMITTLWKADDAATAYIMQHMHLYLQQNKTLDVALQHAKMDYLKDKNISPRMKSPAYWAHLVFIGDFQRGQTDEVIWWIAGISAFAFVMLAMVQFKKKQKRQM